MWNLGAQRHPHSRCNKQKGQSSVRMRIMAASSPRAGSAHSPAHSQTQSTRRLRRSLATLESLPEYSPAPNSVAAVCTADYSPAGNLPTHVPRASSANTIAESQHHTNRDGHQLPPAPADTSGKSNTRPNSPDSKSAPAPSELPDNSLHRPAFASDQNGHPSP